MPLPPATGEDTIFEYVVNSSGTWEHWTNRVGIQVFKSQIQNDSFLTFEISRTCSFHKLQVPEYEYPADTIPDYLSILVPNVDNIRTDFLIDVIAKQGKAVLLTGEQVCALAIAVCCSCVTTCPLCRV